MSLIANETIEKSRVQLKIKIEAADFSAAVSKVYQKQRKNITIPGFRRGKAPRNIIEKMYGKGVFYEDAINDLIPKYYSDAVKEAGIDAVGQPEFEVESADEKEGVVLVVKTDVKPEVKIDGYKGIEVTKEVKKVTDEDIDAEINRVRERNSRMIEVTDRAAALNDTVNIDYEGFVGKTAFEGGKAEGYDLVLGSGSFIPGFEDQIVGHNIGDEFDVKVTFPKEYHAEDLAGKKAVFKTKLNGIKFKELPELDDDFAKDVSDFDTFAEYRADVKSKLEKANEAEADSQVENQLIDALIEKLEADIPESMFVAETENYVRDYDTRLRYQGLDLKTYFQYTGMDLDALRTQLRPQAEKQVKTRLALEKIAELEKIEPSEEEVEAEFKRIADAYGMEVEKVKESVDAAEIAADLKVKGAVELVKAAAKIKKATAKKAPAKKADDAEKKPAAKKTSTKKTAEKAEDKAETAEKKPAAKKAPAKKADDAEKKPAAKKTAAKKTDDAEKKPAAKKAPAKKADAAEKKPATKKTTAKKTEE